MGLTYTAEIVVQYETMPLAHTIQPRLSDFRHTLSPQRQVRH